jgi:RimJ/RimL family protein N-acetyltransferase
MIFGNKVTLREKRLADARNDYSWETDPELAELDAAIPVNAAFSQYLADYASELRYPPPTSRRFAIETLDGKHIGNCAYYNINETNGEAELGIMIGNRDYWNQGYGTDAVATLLNHIFSRTTFNRVYLKTLETNIRAHQCFQKSGFAPCGHLLKDGHHFLRMEIVRHQWQKRQAGAGATLPWQPFP